MKLIMWPIVLFMFGRAVVSYVKEVLRGRN